jgi:TRAP-type uncharacterized transport system substrate-binding protein
VASEGLSRLRWQRPQGRLPLLLGLGALAAAAAIALVAQRERDIRFSMTAGPAGTTRNRIAAALAAEVRKHGGEVRLAAVPDEVDELAQVNAGTVDLALVSGALLLGAHEHLREVTPLYVEALHLAVKPELADAVAADLGALRGRTVDLGPRDSETADLALMVLAFAQLGPESPGAPLRTVRREYEELRAALDAGDPSALPDAVFQLAVVPSQLVSHLVRRAGYRLVSLPFADAMRLNALIGDRTPDDRGVDWQYVSEVHIPAFTYMTRPSVPATALSTIGSRLVLVANERVPEATVRLVLEGIFRTRFARLAEPPLDPSVLSLPPRLALHPGTLAYKRRNEPFITSDLVDKMSNVVGILGAVIGGAIFLYQWRRQRTAARRDELFGSYIVRVAGIEQRVAGLELAATLDLQQLIALQREVLQVKTEALERFAAGDLGNQTMLADLLAPIDAARDHIGELLLHVRENLETKAESEGRSEQAVWREAARATGEPPDKG